MIEVHRLYKRFGPKTVLRDLEFQVAQGEFVALLGPNGAGKTTFLRILSSLSRPTLGEVKIAGHRLPHQAAEVRQRLGVVSHMPLLYGDLTAEENLTFTGACIPSQPCSSASPMYWSKWGCSTGAKTWCGPSRAACSNGWPLAGLCCTTRRCCCWMNRIPGWTRMPVRCWMEPCNRWQPAAARW